LSSEKLARATGFTPQMPFETGLERTVAWYREHVDWTRRVKSGEYRDYYDKNYGSRDVTGPAVRS
jgi:dTDP-glucose 4,6-dehydratase